jgi:hypothetical protein
VLVHEADVGDALPARELEEHLPAVEGPAPRERVAPAGAGEGFPAVLGDGCIVVRPVEAESWLLRGPGAEAGWGAWLA